MKAVASARAYQLRDALIEMTIRYGGSQMAYGMATVSDSGTLDGKPWQYWRRAARRQFKVIQRLMEALRDVEVTR